MIKTNTNMKLKACSRYMLYASFSFLILGVAISSLNNVIERVFADNPAAVVDILTVTVDSNCRITQNGSGSYTKTMDPGTTDSITANTINTVCNDAGGYAIYAIGYSGDSYSGNNTDLISNDNANWNIKTDGSYQSSYWKMQFTASGQANVTSPYTAYQQIPSSYAKVASYDAYTNSGSIIPHYQIHLGQGQPAGTYVGKVRYVLVHPSDGATPKKDIPVSENLYYAITGEANNYTLTISDDESITTGAVASGAVNMNGYSFGEAPWYSYRSQITSVTTTGTVAPTSTAYWFYDTQNCDTFNLAALHTENVTDMNNMFSRAGYNISAFSLDLSGWDVSKVTKMDNMFSSVGYKASTFSLDLSGWDASSVTSMYNMFNDAGYRASDFSLDVSGWDTSEVTNMNFMFMSTGYSASTFSLNLSSWNTSKVENMSQMFASAGYSASSFSLTGLSGWNVSSVTDLSYMFSNTGYNAATWSIGNISSWNTSSLMNASFMFNNAGYKASTFSLNLSSWNTSNVTNMKYMFYQAGYNASTFSLNLSSWNTSKVTEIDNMFYDAGYSASTWSTRIPRRNGNGTFNSIYSFYGKTTSIEAEPPRNRTFTLVS